MKVVVHGLSEVKSEIGKQKYSSCTNYKKIIFCIEQEISCGTLIYNTLTREIILLSNEEKKEFKEVIESKDGDRFFKYLVEHWFYIPVDLDDKTIGYIARTRCASQDFKKNRRVDSFTILTTTSCNASCPYCYEKGIKKQSMSSKVAEDVSQYILKNASSKIALRWFGGEPLCNSEAITAICKKISDYGIPYHSSITSNGFLFNKIEKNIIVDLWKLRNAQITIDGTRENYNRTKSYKSCQEDAYERVLENVKRLLDIGVAVSIRLNISNENTKDMLALIEELKKRFYGYSRIKVYPYPIFEGTGTPAFRPTDSEREFLYDNCILIFEKILACGLSPNQKIGTIKKHHCMADGGKSRVIFPDGRISLCQHYDEKEVCGTIYKNRIDAKKEIAWKKRTSDIENCKKCPQYPICFRLEKCPNEVQCTSGERRFNERKIRQNMIFEYERFVKKLEEG